MKPLRAALLALLIGVGATWAATDPAEMLADPAAEARAAAIGRQLRCMTCQNNAIEDSPSEMARDLRRTVREQVAAGRSEAEVIEFVTARYGDFIRLNPPFTPATVALWGAPVLALAAGALVVLALRRRRPEAPSVPLTEAERKRLDRLTGGRAGA